jgi:conjugal transfer pilus assembly protein TraL
MENSENDYTRVHKYIDAPVMVGSWQIDQFLLAVILISAAYLFPSGVWVLFFESIAIGVLYLYGAYKEGAVRGKGKQLLYSLGLNQPKTLIPSNIRYFVGG